ncbi:integrator complex subunit 11 [Marchantia polymorpha subsp. ruderalis]|uniref:Metallo-beta-lactamase domain-containing protein n=1 Tax=Marchantia polymorpha TaxID=3197 RepID=A0A2R6XCA7_MARPO|nr:hypothetical protein MARPO_0023s0072 [Marchantia polymorpha]BBN01886.1 hypothetical protein Mp_2g11060 [Marchantia polymorpha subsp. ruderalis]|eukprot:PTQ43750.1 hypothetical protein MARPO_0023s0072 [Marchantia polymorpha]
MLIKCVPLGAGQDVGKSCVIVTIGGKNIMFDCGMHMGYQDERRYPKFSFVSKSGNYTQAISCVIITHFHLDHIGALPYFTEVCGYDGPIYMTYPTKALAPLMLEDYRKVLVDKKGEQELFSVAQIQQCMKKVTAVDLKQTVKVDSELEIRAYYAGHVLGAAMFYVKVGDESCVYTGDYNMTPDRHLGAAQIDALQPDLLITESTYATTVRDSKRAREREFLKKVHSCVAGGGKVLIPVFALGRAQELCILLDEYWERMNLKYPIYFSAGLTMQANVYYKLLISWTNQKVKESFVTRNTFDFKHGMLSGGLSLEVFKHWAPSELNMVVVPGFCVAGTVGNKLISGKATKLEIDKRSPVDIRCQVHQLSFSAHTDAKGIMDLVKHVNPRNVVLVHGEKPKMATLKAKIIADLGIPCYDPANYETVEVSSRCAVRINVSKAFVQTNMNWEDRSIDPMLLTRPENVLKIPHTRERTAVEGVVILDETSKLKIIHTTEAPTALNVRQHDMSFTCVCSIMVDITDGEVEEESKLQGLHTFGSDIVKGTSPGDSREAQYGEGGSNLSKSREGPHFQTQGDEDVSRKKYRMDVKRCLSLNLEREPEIEEGEELESLEQNELMRASNPFAGDLQHKIPGTGISRNLDINAVPESSSEMEMEPAIREPSPSPPSPPSAAAVLHALSVGLNHLTSSRSMVVEGEILKSSSFTLRVSSERPENQVLQKPSGLAPRSFTYPESKGDNIVVYSAHCSWSFEDDALANRIVYILRRCKLKMF